MELILNLWRTLCQEHRASKVKTNLFCHSPAWPPHQACPLTWSGGAGQAPNPGQGMDSPIKHALWLDQGVVEWQRGVGQEVWIIGDVDTVWIIGDVDTERAFSLTKHTGFNKITPCHAKRDWTYLEPCTISWCEESTNLTYSMMTRTERDFLNASDRIL